MIKINFSEEEVRYKKKYCNILKEGMRKLGRSNSFEDSYRFNKIYHNLGVALVDVKLVMKENNVSLGILGTGDVLDLELDKLLLKCSLNNIILKGVHFS